MTEQWIDIAGYEELYQISNAYQNELLTISTKPLLVAGAVN